MEDDAVINSYTTLTDVTAGPPNASFGAGVRLR
jgi:hypothetical protein